LSATASNIINQLQQDILHLQGYRRPAGGISAGLGAIEAAFPNRCFPVGAVHEFISSTAEDAAASNAFMAGLAGNLMSDNGINIWVGKSRNLFPPALAAFVKRPEHTLFIETPTEKNMLWVVEEALKCEGLACVFCDLPALDFKTSRRFQLAVEKSHVTGFIHRRQPRQLNTTACVSRWHVTPLPGSKPKGMPGVGYARWQVNLQKVRNGKPGIWTVEWSANGFNVIVPQKQTIWLNAMPQYGSAI